MEEPVDDVKSRLSVGVEILGLSVFDGYRGADKHFAEVVAIKRKGDAISGSAILEELIMKRCDLLFSHKVDRDLSRVNFEVKQQRFDKSPCGALVDF
jgi:hypothetical protein